MCGLNRRRDRQKGIQFRIDAQGDLTVCRGQRLSAESAVRDMAPPKFQLLLLLDGLESLDPIRFQSSSSWTTNALVFSLIIDP